MNHNTLENYYKTQFAMVHHHNYSLQDLENQYPFELDLYISMIEEHQAREREKMQQMKLVQDALERKRRY